MTGDGPAGWAKGAAMTAALGGLVVGASYRISRRLLQKFVLPEPGELGGQRLRHRKYRDLVARRAPCRRRHPDYADIEDRQMKYIISSAIAAAVCGVAGCGDDGTCEFGAEPSGLFSDPADFDQAGCEPESLAGFDPSGFWYVEEEDMPLFSGGGPVRVAASCDDSLAITQSGVGSTILSAAAVQRWAHSAAWSRSTLS